jgi:hypothetical protein
MASLEQNHKEGILEDRLLILVMMQTWGSINGVARHQRVSCLMEYTPVIEGRLSS